MRSLAPAVLVFALAVTEAAAAPAPKGAPGSFTIEHALMMRSYSGLTWSRDGRRLAFVVNVADTAANTTNQDVWMWDAATNDARPLTRDPKNDYNPAFSPGGDTLAFLAARGTGDDVKPAIWFLPLRGGEPWAYGHYVESVGEIAWSPDGRSIAFTMLDTLSKQVREWRKKKWDQAVEDERLQYNHLWVVDVASGRQRRLTSGLFNCAAPKWSPDSRSIACIVNPTGKVDDGNLSDIGVIDAASGALHRLDAVTGSGNFAWSPDSRWLAWTGGADRKVFVAKEDLWVAPAAGGPATNLTRGFDEDAKAPSWSPGSDTLFFHAAIGTGNVVASVPRAGSRVTLGLDRAAEAGGFVAARGGRVAWTQSQSRTPSEIWIAPHPNQLGRAVTELNAGVAKLALGDEQVVRWTSSDGVRVEGMLLRPAGAPPQAPLKTLVLLHGGPYSSRYGVGFDVTAQVMAAHGYQVFMPNFRSSGGYGTAFMVRTRADWGGQDWRDVMTGVDSLVKWGLADSQKLGVFGHSYGGYLSAWAITHTNRFDAAVVSAGAVDLAALWAQSDTHQYRAFEFEGEPWKSFELWRRASPIASIQNAKTPTLILNGEADVRIPFPQAQETYQSLVALGVPCEFVHYPREGHGLREPHHRADWLARQLAWFDRWVR